MAQENQRGFKGVWIPKEIWSNKKLTLVEKVMLIEIDSLDNDFGCIASNAHFAEFFDLTKGRVSQIITSLKNKGFIAIKLKFNGKVCVKRTIEVLNKLNTPPLENYRGYLENDQGSNTSISNTRDKEHYNNACARDENNVSAINTVFTQGQITQDWKPDETTIQQIRLSGVPVDFIAEQIQDFISYWILRGESHQWSAKFFSHVKRQFVNRDKFYGPMVNQSKVARALEQTNQNLRELIEDEEIRNEFERNNHSDASPVSCLPSLN